MSSASRLVSEGLLSGVKRGVMLSVTLVIFWVDVVTVNTFVVCGCPLS